MNDYLKIILLFIASIIVMNVFAINIPKNQDKSTTGSILINDEKNETYHNQIFDPTIKTMLLYTTESELNPPVIRLNGSEKLILNFDDLGEDVRDMYYRFEHCTFDWKPSGLHIMDYQEGYKTDYIDDFQYSFNTIQSYTHYHLEFPNDNIKLTSSGNYVIKVFADDDENQPILTARFMIVDPVALIEASVQRSNIVSERNYRQKINVKINLGSLQVSNPYRDIELVVLQNNRFDNAKHGLKPSFINDNELIYDFQDELTFDGINEFRFFDAKSVRYRSERVAEVALENDGYHIYLSPDVRRAFKLYSTQQDINGKLLIKNDDMQNASLESDYVTIHFEMPVDAFLGKGDMYLFGQLSNWEINSAYKMDYNPLDLKYEKTIKLKQGYYNYLYLWKYPNQDVATTDLTEGNHFETENDYYILLYYKDSRTFSDRLVGYKRINSYKQ